LTSMKAVLGEASKLVSPSKVEARNLTGIADKTIERVRASSSRFREVRGVHPGGSFAKGTWLPHDVDLDIFVRIADDVEDSRFERIGLAVGEEAVRGYPHGKKYAQHPYTEATVDGVKVNIVPCYDVKAGNWKSAADRSLYHVKFVNEKMSPRDKLEVRLLKRFMKTVHTYGAEIENEGFSGYASEVLVYSHHGFEGVLKHFAQLRLGPETTFSLKDPVDPDRELGTAISKETVGKMVLASRAFVRAPELDYFKKLRQRPRSGLIPKLYCIRFDHAALSEDTLWGELKKTTRKLVKYVEGQGFSIARSAAISNNTDKSAIILLPEVDELPDIVERLGPSIDLTEEVNHFVLKNKKKSELIWVSEDGRLHMLQRRKFTRLGKLLVDLSRNGMEGIGPSRDIARSVKATGRMLTGPSVLTERASEGWFSAGVDNVVTDSIGTDSR